MRHAAADTACDNRIECHGTGSVFDCQILQQRTDLGFLHTDANCGNRFLKDRIRDFTCLTYQRDFLGILTAACLLQLMLQKNGFQPVFLHAQIFLHENLLRFYPNAGMASQKPDHLIQIAVALFMHHRDKAACCFSCFIAVTPVHNLIQLISCHQHLDAASG